MVEAGSVRGGSGVGEFLDGDEVGMALARDLISELGFKFRVSGFGVRVLGSNRPSHKGLPATRRAKEQHSDRRRQP